MIVVVPAVSVNVPINEAPFNSVIVPVVVMSPINVLALIVIILLLTLKADNAFALILTL